MIVQSQDRWRTHLRFAAACVTMLGVAMFGTHQADAQMTERVSVDGSGNQGNGASGLQQPAISADGRYVAFESDATNLVPGDTNGRTDIFFRDRQTGAIERISVASDGSQADQSSQTPSITADGRYVAFWSHATNLVPGDTNGFADIFVRDRVAGTTERVSVDSVGVQATRPSEPGPSISGDGRYVAFASSDDYLVGDDNNRVADIFVYDRQTRIVRRVSVSSSGAQADLASSRPKISADGRYVAFLSQATNLVSGDTNGTQDAFVHDLETRATERVSVGVGGSQGAGITEFASISGDGRFAAFLYWADDLVPTDTNGASDVFVRDRVGGSTQLVSVSSAGVQGNASPYDPGLSSYDPQISATGQYVVFSSWASNLVPGDLNEVVDVFVHDRVSGATERMSVSTAGLQAQAESVGPAVSADGRSVVFRSYASNLVPDDTNGVSDVFVRNRGVGERLTNISTRASVLTGNNVMIGGFWIGGTAPKTVLIRARGGSLAGAPFNNSGVLRNPTLVLYSGATAIAQSDNWQSTDPLCVAPASRCGNATQIRATGLDPCQPNPGQSAAPPDCAQEAALLVTLAPGGYTAIVSGVNGTIGMGLIEVFDVDASTAKLVNISTRTVVQTGANVMIGGFWIGGSAPKTVLIRARGGSLGGAPFNNPGVLANPTLQLISGSTVIAQNNDWVSTDSLCLSPATACGDAPDISATGLDPCQPNPGQTAPPPGCGLESAILVTLAPGGYTGIVSGVGGSAGLGLVEVFEMP